MWDDNGVRELLGTVNSGMSQSINENATAWVEVTDILPEYVEVADIFRVIVCNTIGGVVSCILQSFALLLLQLLIVNLCSTPMSTPYHYDPQHPGSTQQTLRTGPTRPQESHMARTARPTGLSASKVSTSLFHSFLELRPIMRKTLIHIGGWATAFPSNLHSGHWLPGRSSQS